MSQSTRHHDHRWGPTHAQVRAYALVAVAAVSALLWRRPDLVVLATPLATVLVWGLLDRPRRLPAATLHASHDLVQEGQQIVAVTDVRPAPHLELLASSVADAPFVIGVPDPQLSHTALAPAGASLVRLPTPLRLTRWGVRRVGPVLVGGTTAWGAWAWGPVRLDPVAVRALPNPEAFDVSAPAPHPRGLVGAHRSARRGEGAEFATIRPFQWGDRLKRINWRQSLRTGDLHVSTTYAEEDTHLALIVDAHYDLGRSGGVFGAPSSLDQTVRAAAAVSSHFLGQGDRVSLQVLSARSPLRVPTGAGRRQGLRVLDTLAQVVPAVSTDSDPRRLRRDLGPDALVVMVSSLVSPDALTQAATLARSGHSVVVIDALVDDVASPEADDAFAELTWRLRMLERDGEIRRIVAAGVPVVPWRGPGSLDLVLRQLGRRGRRAAGAGRWG